MRFYLNVLSFCLSIVLSLPGVAFAQAPKKPVASTGYVTQGKTVSGVAAVVNGEMISWHDLQLQSAPEIARARIRQNDPQAMAKVEAIHRNILDTMILDMLVSQEAERFKMKASESDVDAEIKKILASNKINLETLERSLSAQGLSLEFLKKRIRRNLTNTRLMTMMVGQKVIVPDAEIEKYYNEHKDEFVKGKTVKMQLIIFPPPMADQVPGIISQIKSGKLSFEQAAKMYSAGPGADAGGNIGEREWEALPPASRAALKNVPVGGLTPVFKVEDADAVAKVLSVTQGEPKNFKEAAPEVDRILKEPLLQERFKEYSQSLKNKAVIDVKI